MGLRRAERRTQRHLGERLEHDGAEERAGRGSAGRQQHAWCEGVVGTCVEGGQSRLEEA